MMNALDPRIVQLEGGNNFRDIGGYRTKTGQMVKTGLVYRAGSLAGLTDADMRQVARLGIKLVCDLRSNRERSNRPSRWAEDYPISFWSRDHEMSAGDLIKKLLRDPDASDEVMRAQMVATYRELPYEQAESYKAMFRQIAEGELPLLFHCTAGKDRTGIAAALLLELLGVPRETIIEDYMLTEVFFDHILKLIAADPYFGEGKIETSVVKPLVSAERLYLETMYETLEHDHGSVAGYMRDRLDVDEELAEAIRARLLDSHQSSVVS
jgi:protein-tyrosine phosphatase